MFRCFCALDNITIFKWLNMILEWFCICLCVHVHLCVNAQLEASGWQVSSSIISALIFFTEFFTEPGAHWFGLTGWPASPKDLPVSLPRTGVIDSAALPVFVTWCWEPNSGLYRNNFLDWTFFPVPSLYLDSSQLQGVLVWYQMFLKLCHRNECWGLATSSWPSSGFQNHISFSLR